MSTKQQLDLWEDELPAHSINSELAISANLAAQKELSTMMDELKEHREKVTQATKEVTNKPDVSVVDVVRHSICHSLDAQVANLIGYMLLADKQDEKTKEDILTMVKLTSVNLRKLSKYIKGEEETLEGETTVNEEGEEVDVKAGIKAFYPKLFSSIVNPEYTGYLAPLDYADKDRWNFVGEHQLTGPIFIDSWTAQTNDIDKEEIFKDPSDAMAFVYFEKTDQRSVIFKGVEEGTVAYLMIRDIDKPSDEANRFSLSTDESVTWTELSDKDLPHVYNYLVMVNNSLASYVLQQKRAVEEQVDELQELGDGDTPALQ